MQIREQERTLGRPLFERRPGETVLTPLGAEVAERASRILIATNDLVDIARHGERLLSGALVMGMIPTLAPYVLPRILPRLRAAFPELKLELREAQTRPMLDELSRGQLDLVMAALPVEEADLETLMLFKDRFLLAVPSGERWPERRVDPADVDPRRLILLEEGHCLRDQALAYCAVPRRDASAGLGATSLSTVMQMVASGYGVTLVPEVALDAEARGGRIQLRRFKRPEPTRQIGLVWRRTSPRKAEFHALARAIQQTMDAS
jgi:LysR family hydrogen peroxide-inducible transcriptional activator